jgi:hypothetical protein
MGDSRRTDEYNPASDCTDFISQVHDDESLYAQTIIETPEGLEYLQFLEDIGREDGFNIASAQDKARRLATMMISTQSGMGRSQNVIGLVGHPGQQQINQYSQTPPIPIQAIQPLNGEQKKKHWWSRG